MPMIQGSTSTAAGQITQNVLQGSVYEYLPFNCLVEIGVCDAAAGEQRVTILSGSDTLLEESPVATPNRFPVYPDDFIFQDYAGAGERLVIRTRNTGAGANILRWSVRLTPV